jgi:hypothetical protein
MDPATFLTVADLFQASSFEAERRTAIGRSYYALYNVVLSTLSSQGISFSHTGNDHRQLVEYLFSCGHRQAAHIGSALRDLRVWRNNSDYEMHVVIDVPQSQLAYAKAKQAVDRFNRLPAVDLETMVQAMKRIGPRPPRRRGS